MKHKGNKTDKTQIMGVLNVTPDSFFAPSRISYDSALSMIEKIEHLEAQGATWIDIGAESTAPGAKSISQEEELKRLEPLFEALQEFSFSASLSIDTCKPLVASKAIKNGFKMINDVTGLRDPVMRKLVADSGVKVCVMHMGNPSNKPLPILYPEGIITYLKDWFSRKVTLLLECGIAPEQIILDPGIGGGRFGKSVEDNIKILHNLHQFQTLGFPILIGISRKKFLQQLTSQNAENTLPATLAGAVIAIQQGVNILRVHDVSEHKQIVDFLFNDPNKPSPDDNLARQ